MTIQQEVVAMVGMAEIALFDHARECDDPYYERTQAGRWDSTRDGATTLLRWGPFFSTTTIDRVCLMREDAIIEEVPLPARVIVPKGSEFEYHLTVAT